MTLTHSLFTISSIFSIVVAVGSACSLVCHRVWTTCWFAHNNLVNLKKGQNYVERKLESPGFALKIVKNTRFDSIFYLAIAYVNAVAEGTFINFGVQIGQNCFCFESRVFCQDSWDYFERDSKLLHCVLIETRLSLSELLHFVCDVNFGRSCTCNETRISNKRFHCIHSIINSAFNIIEHSMS